MSRWSWPRTVLPREPLLTESGKTPARTPTATAARARVGSLRVIARDRTVSFTTAGGVQGLQQRVFWGAGA
jgi:hypothetical protein